MPSSPDDEKSQFWLINGGGGNEGSGEKQEAPKRDLWGSQKEFLLSCVGYTVGLGNIWRFPYLAYQSGGGAFLIPYIVMLITCGMPMYIMEVALGQYIAEGPIQVWRIVCPLFRGIGYSMLMVSFLVGVYYNVIIAWVLFYLFASFRADIPWRHCDPTWATKYCLEGPRPSGNGSLFNTTTGMLSCLKGFDLSTKLVNGSSVMYCKPYEKWNYPSIEYFSNYVLEQTNSIDDTGKIRWQLVLCLLLSWMVVYFCMWKGVKSAGKVVYFTATFPYVVLLILLVRGLTLPNAIEGVTYYIKPDFEKIAKPEVWAAAGGQLFYSLGPAFGSLLSFASYNKFNNNCIRDAMFISALDACTSSLAGLVIFSVLGSMAKSLNVDVKDVATHGPGLAFMVYPEGISQMPLSTFWSIIFFFMLFTLGLDSQFGMMECIVTNLVDEYPTYLRKRKELFIFGVCVTCFLFGFTIITQAGIYWFTIFDYQSAGVCLIFVAFVEIIVVGWFFDADRLLKMVEQMVGYKPSRWWRLCWKFISPVIMGLVLIFKLTQWEGISYGTYKFPPWAEAIGWMLALATAIMIPLFAVITLFKADGNSLWQKIKTSVRPKIEILNKKGAENGVEESFPLGPNKNTYEISADA
eukprot:TCONS_00048314-protein